VAAGYVSAGLSLLAATSWGAGDFSGGVAAKRAPVLPVVVLSQAAGSLLMVALALAMREPVLTSRAALFCVLSGFGNAVGISFLYRALAIEKMGISAPIAAVVTAIVPVIFTIAGQGFPTALQLAGFGLALVAIWLIANTGATFTFSAGAKLAVISGLGFSVYLVLIKYGGAEGAFWPVAVSRGTSSVLALLVAIASRASWQGVRQATSVISLAGLFDASGTVLFLLATHRGRLDVAAVLASLYPASTVILARLLLKERLSRSQMSGLGAALLAVAMIASA
jgi:drug/metabolite transporter (DMT)-like permease